MEVCDAEWQWDRRKVNPFQLVFLERHAFTLHPHQLTFYYTSGNRVDFRELVRELFRLYKTRICEHCTFYEPLFGPTDYLLSSGMCCLDQAEAAWSFK